MTIKRLENIDATGGGNNHQQEKPLNDGSRKNSQIVDLRLIPVKIWHLLNNAPYRF